MENVLLQSELRGQRLSAFWYGECEVKLSVWRDEIAFLVRKSSPYKEILTLDEISGSKWAGPERLIGFCNDIYFCRDPFIDNNRET